MYPPLEIINGDNVQVLTRFPSECVDLIVTSPPYDDLRTYNGYSFDFEATATELFRVTKPGGVLVWIVADATQNGDETGTSFRQALFFKDCGFRLHDTMIWAKDAIKFPDANRYQQSFEYMFVLSKGAPKTINLIKDRENVSFGRTVSGTLRNKDGSTQPMSGLGKSIAQYGCRWNIWGQGGEKGAIRKMHPAVFPEKLAEDHIRSWSNPGDVVLDPFCGSGTTGKMALKNGRLFSGIEISQEYCKISAQRMGLE